MSDTLQVTVGTTVRVGEVAVAAVDAATMRQGLDAIGVGSAVRDARVEARPGTVEITAYDPTVGYWETVIVPCASWAAPGAERRPALDVSAASLQAALRGHDGEVALSFGDRLAVEHVAVAAASEPVPPAPRPTMETLLKQRVEMPRSTAPMGVVLRLDGPNVCVPEGVRVRFGRRGVTLTSLYEDAGSWYLSGVVSGSLAVAIVGAVGVY